MKIVSAIAVIFIFAVAAMAQTNDSSNAVPFLGDIPQFHLTTNNLSDAEIQGHNLAKQLCNAIPATNFDQTGILKIQSGKNLTTNIPISFKVAVSTERWIVGYYAPGYTSLAIVHPKDQTNRYVYSDERDPKVAASSWGTRTLRENEITIPFANSDFWLCDLGLEFFHWPEQKIIKKEFARGRGCMVLESTNPNPSPNGYSRVDCWIDEETLGIVQAKAYDASGKLLKEFDPKSFKKDVNGQWQLQEMEIRNVQTRSRTEIKFDLKNNP